VVLRGVARVDFRRRRSCRGGVVETARGDDERLLDGVENMGLAVAVEVCLDFSEERDERVSELDPAVGFTLSD